MHTYTLLISLLVFVLIEYSEQQMTGGVCSIKYHDLEKEEKAIIDDTIENGLKDFNNQLNSMVFYRIGSSKENLIVTKQVVAGIIYTVKVTLVPTSCFKNEDILPTMVKLDKCEVSSKFGESIDREFVLYMRPSASKQYSIRKPVKLPYDLQCPH